MTSDASPFVGRQAERARAAAALAGVQDGVGVGLVIEGEPGIGKSTLARRCLADLRVTTWIAICSDLETDLPYAPWVRLLRLRRTSDDPFRRQLAEAMTDPDAPPTVRLRLLDGIGELVEREALERPVALFLDDLQWADERSLTALRSVAELALELPIALVVTRRPIPRPQGIDAWERPLDRAGRLTRLVLGPLPPADVELLGATLLGRGLDDRGRAALAAASGNPLFVREVVLGHLDRPAQSGDAGADAGVRAAVLRHLDFVPDGVWPLLRTAAALGRSFDVADLALVEALDTTQVVPALTPVVRAGVLDADEARTDSDDDGVLRFAHDLVRDAVLDSETPPERAVRQARIVVALADAGRPPRDWASHLLHADRSLLDDAPRRCAQAGLALLGSDLRGAIDLLRDAVDAGADRPETVLQLACAEFLTHPVRDHDQDRRVFTEALRGLFGRSDTPPRIVDHLLSLFPILDPPAQALLLADLDEEPVTAALRPALALPWERMDDISRGRRSRQDVEAIGEVVHQLLATGDPIAGHVASTWEAARRPIHLLAGRRAIVEVSEQALALDERRPGVLTLLQRVDLRERVALMGALFEVGPFDGADRRWAEVRADLDALDLQTEATIADFYRLQALFRDVVRNHHEIADAAPQFVAWLEQQRLPMGRWPAIWLEWHGELDEHPLLAEVLADSFEFPVWHAFVRGDHGRCAEAMESALHLARSVEPDGWPVRGQQFALARRIGRPDLVRGEGFILRDPQEDPVSAALAADDPDAVLAAIDGGFPPIGHLGLDVREDAADLLAEQGRTDEAIEVLRRSLADWHEIGATRCVQRVTASLRALGVSPKASAVRRSATFGWDAVTDAEWRVLDLLEQDLIYREIADHLFLSRRTVESHVAHVFRKLEVSGRRNLARILREGEGAERLAELRTGSATSHGPGH